MTRLKNNRHMTLLRITALAGVLFFSGPSSQALAAAATCPVGLPCDTPLTPNPNLLNDEIGPIDDGSGPNITGMPNAIKTGEAQACDADFMNQIYGKAFLEAEREMVSANAIMLKPDSVLEYTCFDVQASQIANAAAPIFSIPTGKITSLIENLTLKSLKAYVDANFWHDFLGGADAGNNNTISASVSGGTSACDVMYSVFEVAKCSDFGLEAPYMTFEELLGYDPRQLPRVCPSMHQITQEIIDLANNTGNAYAATDPIVTFLDHTSPAAANNDCEFSDPLPTGVTVYYRQYGQDLLGRPTVIDSYEFEDKVCTNPGCYFDNKGNANGADDECVP